MNKIEEQYGQSISVSRLLQKSGGSSDVGKCDWLSVLSLTPNWSIDCGSGLSLRGPGGAAVSWVWRRSELPNLKQYLLKALMHVTLFFIFFFIYLVEIPTDTPRPRGRAGGYVGLEPTKTTKVIYLARGAARLRGGIWMRDQASDTFATLPPCASCGTARGPLNTGSSLGEYHNLPQQWSPGPATRDGSRARVASSGVAAARASGVPRHPRPATPRSNSYPAASRD